jgi:geranylgeranyl pyrophosphate synthase
MIYADNWNIAVPKQQEAYIDLSTKENLDLETIESIVKTKSALQKIYLKTNKLEFSSQELAKLLNSVSKTLNDEIFYDPKGPIPFPKEQPVIFIDGLADENPF